jgi:acetaldehyde dehydrogenase (acetylating)
VQCSNEDTPVAKTAVEFNTPKLSEPMINLVPEKLLELKLPKFDLEALFSVQTANLAAANQAQIVLVDAAQAVARVQYGYVEQTVAHVKAALGTKELP